MRQPPSSWMWVWVAAGGRVPGGVYSAQPAADAWIAREALSGTLTRYPVDLSVYEWAIAEGRFTPKRDQQRSAEFIGAFSSAGQDHSHYENGTKAGGGWVDTVADEPRPRWMWIFVGAKAQFPSGVFSERPLAESWVRENSLSGTLARYAVDAAADAGGEDECRFELGTLLVRRE